MSEATVSDKVFQARIANVRAVMRQRGLEAIVIPASGELAWLCGHAAHSFDQNICLVMTDSADDLPMLVIAGLELPAVQQRPAVFGIAEFGGDKGSMVDVIIEKLGKDFDGQVGVGDKLWAEYLLDLRGKLPKATWHRVTPYVNELRRTKDRAEVLALRAVATAVDSTIRAIQRGEVPLRGRTEKAVANDVTQLLLKHGHDKVDFVIVAYGPNAADPHHEPDDTVIGDGIVLFDIGGTKSGYCSDTTRCVHVGEPTEKIARAYEVLREAQHAALDAARPGISGVELDAVARNILVAAGYPSYPHGLSHGIGRETHEAPRAGFKSKDVLKVGDVLSIEPGIYVAGEWGMRLEDIIVIIEDGAACLNLTPDDLIIVEK